jgi:hypothetical protein
MDSCPQPNVPAGVLHPSAKKPPHPVKAAVRVSVKRLANAGVSLRQTQVGYPALFGMAKNDPKLLETILQAAEKSTANEKKLWREVLSSTFFSVPSAEYARYTFNRYLQIIPVTARGMKPHSVAWEALAKTRKVFSQINEARPEAQDNLGLLHDAAFLYAEVSPPVHYRKRETKLVTKDNIEDIVFIAEHYDEVKRILPELKKRGVIDRGTVAALLEIEAAALLDGAL